MYILSVLKFSYLLSFYSIYNMFITFRNTKPITEAKIILNKLVLKDIKLKIYYPINR